MFDPWLFNKIIITLYAANVLWSLWHKNWFNVCYWLSALGITLTVTFIPKS